jgi:hypothetical protein
MRRLIADENLVASYSRRDGCNLLGIWDVSTTT